LPAAIAAGVVGVATTAIVVANRPSNAAATLRDIPPSPPVVRTLPAQPAMASPGAGPAATQVAPPEEASAARHWLDSLRAVYPLAIAPAAPTDSADRVVRERAAASARERSAADSIADLVPGARVRVDTSSSPDSGTTPP
jgi:hypothetical protein